MQRTEVQNKRAGNEVVRTDRTCISRDQPDTLWISWNVAANSSSSGSAKMSSLRFARFREDSNLGSCVNFHGNPRRTNSSQGSRAVSETCYNITQLCGRMAPTYHRAALNKTLLERKRSRDRFLVLQTETERTNNVPKRRQTPRQIHHQSNRNWFCF